MLAKWKFDTLVHTQFQLFGYWKGYYEKYL